MEKLILCDAVPFCFGPIAKLISVAQHLKNHNARLILLASNTSKELGEKSGLFEVVECNTEDLNDLEKVRGLFEKASVFLTVMNPAAVTFAQSVGTPIVYIDSLFWMWDAVPKNFAKIDKYFIQEFFDAKEALNRYSFLKNAELVGPIIDDTLPVCTKKEDYIVVNFGGMESALIQVGKNSNYPFVVGKIIVDSLNRLGKKAFVCGNDSVLKKLGIKNGPFVAIGGKSHKDFLELIRKASLLITTPGLTTTFEAFHYKTPVVFLPPENYSQFLNLKILREEGVAGVSFHWLDVFNGLDIKVGEDEHKGVDKVLSCIKRFESDAAAQKKLSDFLDKVLASPPGDILRQSEYINNLGERSAQKVALYVAKRAGV